MPTPLKDILRSASHVAKQNLTSEITCPGCGERQRLIKWGFYTRYLFAGADTIRIQRVRCLNPQCTKCTFNVLPHPLLPILRVPLCFLQALLDMNQKGRTIAEISQHSGKSWPVIRRCLSMARRVQAFLVHQVESIIGLSSACLCPKDCWTRFTHAFSWAFFPKLHRKIPPT
jgi:hypothetical protein